MPTRTIEHKMILQALDNHYWVPYFNIVKQLQHQVSPERAKRAFRKHNPDVHTLTDEDQIECGTRILLWDAADAAVKAGDIEMRHEIVPINDKVKVVWVRPTKLSASYIDNLMQTVRTIPSPPTHTVLLDVDSSSYPNLVSVSPVKDNKVELMFNYSFNNKFPLHTFKILLSSATAVKLADQLQQYGLAINDFGGHDIDDPSPF